MNIESMIDELLAYVDRPYFVPRGGRDFPRNVPIHEAGHAIVARVAQGRQAVPYVFMEPDGRDFGYAGHQPIQPGDTRQQFDASTKAVFPYHPGLERILIVGCAVKLAGLAAEAIASGMGWRYTLVQRRIAYAGQDAIDCAEYCSLVEGWDFRRVAVPAWPLAFRILESKWPEVEELAAGIEPTAPPPHVRDYFRGMAA